MKKKTRRRRMRITRRGYVVLCALLLFVMIIVCVCLLSCQSKSEAEEADPSPSSDPAGSPASAITQTPAPTEAPTPVPSPTPGLAASGARMPTAEEDAAAASGIIRTSGVVLRKGPGQSFDIIQKYDDGERVLVYAKESDYYLVQVLNDGQYGYMSTEFIIKFGLLTGEEASATPVPAAPEGAIMGIVNVSEVSLRSVPSTKNNTPIGICSRGMLLWIRHKEDGFYYAEVASTGEKGYVFAKYIMTQAEVPAGTAG